MEELDTTCDSLALLGLKKSEEEESTRSEISEQYNPSDHARSVDVSNDFKELFKIITNYTPKTLELKAKIKPFIPEYIPVANLKEAFIKIPPPDEEEEQLGIYVLDEPCLNQSENPFDQKKKEEDI